MNDSSGCARCGSMKVIPRVPLLDHFGDVGGFSKEASVEVAGVPSALCFKDKVSGKVHARLGAECGYTELFTSHAQELYEKYLEAEEGRG